MITKSLSKTIGIITVFGTFIWFPLWMILKTFYNYDLSFIPIFAVDLIFIYNLIFTYTPNLNPDVIKEVYKK